MGLWSCGFGDRPLAIRRVALTVAGQLILALVFVCSAAATKSNGPSIEDYATIESYCNGIPVYSFGNIAYIYGVSPDLMPGARMQDGNTNPSIKIKPKKSWEIKSNLFGVTICEPGARTMWNDSQPMLPIHLIDGDPDTAWCSYGSVVPDARPEWIRIDLPRESTVSAVALVCSQDFAQRKLWKAGKLLDRIGYHEWAGRALPNELTIQVSQDAWHWKTVYENKSFAGNEDGATVIDFVPCQAKQILITGKNFKRKLSKVDADAFSIGEVEIRDTAGDNLALISRGAGVTVSSTSTLLDHDRYTQNTLFGPVQYDLGLKYVRIGADNGMLTWNYVEREKGKMTVDPIADGLITEMRRNGIDVIMNLDVKANWNYRGEKYGQIKDPFKYSQGYNVTSDFVYRGQKPEWKQARIREINNIYYDFPGWAWETPEMTEGYLRYVAYMVKHFKGRVAYYEIGNEWNGPRDIYARAVRTTKKIDPNAKIMACVGRMYEFPEVLKKLKAESSEKDYRDLMPDAVGSHPTTRSDAGMTADDLKNFYWEENRKAIKECIALGYKGKYIASEIYSWTLYPPGPRELNAEAPQIKDHVFGDYVYGETEMGRAKYIAQVFVGHAGLNMLAFQCNTYFVGNPVGQSLFRVAVPSQIVSPIEPDAGYYTLRTLCTVLDSWKGAEFPVKFSGDKNFQVFTLERGSKELMVAAWIPGNPTSDGVVEAKTDVTLPGVRAAKAWVIDVLNGTDQELNVTQSGGNTVLTGMLVKDYSVLIRIEKQ